MDLSRYILEAGRNELDPLVLLTARGMGYSGKNHQKLAAVLEMIHTATLLHDDVVDDSKMRRGKASANVVWGNEARCLLAITYIQEHFN